MEKSNYIRTSTEKWQTINDFPNYAISDLGRVMRIGPGQHTHPGKILKHGKHRYLYVGLMKNKKTYTIRIHNLVLKAFLGPCPKGKETNHINGIKIDNRAENLEYVTKTENSKHAYSIGLRKPKRGSKNGQSKLNEKQVLEIIKLNKMNMSNIELSKNFGIKKSQIRRILNGERWNWLTRIKKTISV